MAKRCSARPQPAPRLALVAAVFWTLGTAGCTDPGAPPVTPPPPSPAGNVDGGAVDRGPDTADRTPDAKLACSEVDAESRFAEWPLPDPTITTGAKAQGYDLSAADVAIDNVTGLAWQRRSSASAMTWAQARVNCACLELGGRRGWRLPTRMELLSIVDFTRRAPAIDATAFPGTPDEWFWTSSLVTGQPGFVWYLYFDTGFSKFIDAEADYRVRCVHGPAVSAVNRQPYRIEAATVLDARTGLTWQRIVDQALRTQGEAKAYCASLATAGGGWRLPGMKELQSLVDDDRADPSIDEGAFPDTPAESFWTDTPVKGIDGSAWRVSFHQGYAYDEIATYRYRARCVR